MNMGGLKWDQTHGGAWRCGPYTLCERIDGKGWNATALFERCGEPEPVNTSVQIKMACPTLVDAVDAVANWHRDVITHLSRAGLI